MRTAHANMGYLFTQMRAARFKHLIIFLITMTRRPTRTLLPPHHLKATNSRHSVMHAGVANLEMLFRTVLLWNCSSFVPYQDMLFVDVVVRLLGNQSGRIGQPSAPVKRRLWQLTNAWWISFRLSSVWLTLICKMLINQPRFTMTIKLQCSGLPLSLLKVSNTSI